MSRYTVTATTGYTAKGPGGNARLEIEALVVDKLDSHRTVVSVRQRCWPEQLEATLETVIRQARKLAFVLNEAA